MIASLRDGSKGEVASGISSSEYEEVCHERDMLKDEVNQFKYRMEQLKADLQVTILCNLMGYRDTVYLKVIKSYPKKFSVGVAKCYPLNITIFY